MNTQENNKLIAEFMGGKLIFPSTCNYGVFEFSKKDKYILTYNVEPTTENGIAQHLLKFNTSWDWLMKVVDKIESMGFCFDIMGKACSISRHDEMIVDLNGNDFDKKIDSVYFACVDFLEWYTTV